MFQVHLKLYKINFGSEECRVWGSPLSEEKGVSGVWVISGEFSGKIWSEGVVVGNVQNTT